MTTPPEVPQRPTHERLATLARRMEQHLSHDEDRPTWLHWTDARLLHEAAEELTLQARLIDAQRRALDGTMKSLMQHKEALK